MPFTPEEEARIARLERLVGSPPPDALYAGGAAPWQLVDRNGKTYVRSVMTTEVDDASEFGFGRIQHAEPWNNEGPKPRTTITILYGYRMYPNGDDPLRNHPDYPEVARNAQIDIVAVGEPNATNRGGQVVIRTQKKGELGLKRRLIIDDDGALRLGDGPTGAVIRGKDATIPARDWVSIGNARGLIVVGNKSDGTNGGFVLDGESDDILQLWGKSYACNVLGDDPGRPALVLNWRTGYNDYRILNFHSQPKVVQWFEIGAVDN
jgi:hypothetical protein